MAAPNIVNVSTITGRTVGAALTTSSADIVTNSAGSGKVFKVNTILVANVDGVNNADVTVGFYNADNTTTYKIAHTITVPADATLDVMSKAIYLEEGDKITALASANSSVLPLFTAMPIGEETHGSQTINVVSRLALNPLTTGEADINKISASP